MTGTCAIFAGVPERCHASEKLGWRHAAYTGSTALASAGSTYHQSPFALLLGCHQHLTHV